MASYRSRGRVVMDLLAAIEREGPVGITRLITVANMTHTRVQEHLTIFVENALVVDDGKGERAAWMLSQKGREALAELRRVDRAMRDFGLDL